jgi:hypothetical protein
VTGIDPCLTRKALIASTVSHAILLATLLIIGTAPIDEDTTPPTNDEQLVPAPEPVHAAIQLIDPPATTPTASNDSAWQLPDPNELPSLAANNPRPASFADTQTSSDSHGSGDDHAAAGWQAQLPSASQLAGQAAGASASTSTAQLERSERQMQEAGHVLAGWIINHYRRHWRDRYRHRVSGARLILAVTVDAQQRVLDLKLAHGSTTGVTELDSQLMLLVAERARSGQAWGLPPLPNRGRHTYHFQVVLPP